MPGDVEVCGYGPGLLCACHQLVKSLALVWSMVTWPPLNQSRPVPGRSPAWSTAHWVSRAGASAIRAPYGSRIGRGGVLLGRDDREMAAGQDGRGGNGGYRPAAACDHPLHACLASSAVHPTLPCTVRRGGLARYPVIAGNVAAGMGGRGRAWSTHE